MRGLLVPPEPDDAPLPPFEVIAGGHPLPTAGSVRAAERAPAVPVGDRRRTRGVPGLRRRFGAARGSRRCRGDAARTARALPALVACGADIRTINTVRRQRRR
ncbi:MAG: hypothetical protein U1E73_08890 [Planctomycetota bacterium]